MFSARAEKQGDLCPGKEITEAVMADFYQKHPPGELASPEGIAAKYRGKCSKLLRLLKNKYGEAPLPVDKKSEEAVEDEMDGVTPPPKVASLAGVPEAELRAELVRRDNK